MMIWGEWHKVKGAGHQELESASIRNMYRSEWTERGLREERPDEFGISKTDSEEQDMDRG
jgi:hypothetical protein